MRQYPIRSRYISLLLLVAMLFSLLPALQFTAEAAEEAHFLTAADDGITMLNNGNTISMSIKTNNFVLDGMLFDYLSSTRSANNADDYLWEYCKDVSGNAFVQLYPYKLRNQDLGQGKGDTGHGLADPDGFVGVVPDGTLDTVTTTTGDYYGTRSDGVRAIRALIPETRTDDGDGIYDSDDETAFVRLFPRMWKDTYETVPGIYDGDNPNGVGKGRGWIKLTTFESTQKVDNIRYAVVVYRLPNGNKITNGTHSYSNFGLTVNSFDEGVGNVAKYANINPAGGNEWQFAIIDLMGRTDTNKIVSGTNVNTVYLQAPLAWNENGTDSNSASTFSYLNGQYYMDIAAVGYFPYYGDAEQFGYAGLTLGCQQKYFNANNAGFSLRNNSSTHYSLTGNTRAQVLVKSLPTFWTDNEYLGSRAFGVDTYNTDHYSNAVQDIASLKDVLNPNTTDGTTKSVLDTTGTNLFGSIKGQATFGLVESALGEDGRPVFKESVVRYMAAYLRHQLLTIPEYPYDNNGWRNYSFITGVSTSGGTNEALFGTDELGRPMDLGTALCKQIGVEKGGAITSQAGSFGKKSYYDYNQAGPDNAYLGSYAATLAHKDELIGTWSNCKKNIHTWYDAAYFLLNNLYVTETDTADTKVDGYGEYEDDYQSLILPQIQYKDGTTPYFFDSGYAYYTDINDSSTYTSALTLDKTQHTISLNGDAQGAAQFIATSGQNATSWFPFLITSGNGTAAGESNSSYYLHDGVLSREKIGTTYRSRDFHYAMSGNGYFAYEPGLYFNFQGDDDVYVFINGQLVVDLGGTHGATTYEMKLDDYVTWAKSVKNNGVKYKGKTYAQLTGADKARVDALCLVTGGVYSFDFFYMERHGVGSNLRIMTNMKIVESSLGVDKFAYQNGIEVIDNGMANANEPIEYGFSITNNSDGKLYDLSFSDTVIGVTLDPENGLQVTGNVTDAIGAKLTPASLVITVDGYDASGKKIDTINVSCPNNEALIQFLKTLSSEGTEGGVVEEDFSKPYAGTGLWKDSTVTVRGIYYQMTEAQKKVNSFTNSVVGSGFAKVAGENGTIDNYVLRGVAKHTIYQPGQPAYYQWVGNPIVIESERLYNDLIEGNIVESAADLPKPANMILIPSNSGGTEIASDDISNVPGGDVYLKINYTAPGSYMAYVTIRDAMDPTYSMTVPITVYAMGGQDSTFVLDYGLDTYLTDNDAIFDYELGAAAGDVDGSVLGIADSSATPGYVEYDEDAIINAAGQMDNNLSVVAGTYNSSTGDHDGVVYELDTPVFLDHNKPWVIEWKALHEGVGTLLFSEMETSGDGNMYIFLSPNNKRIFMGRHEADDAHHNMNTNALTYNNYGVEHDAIKNAVGKMTEFKLVNVPDGAGGNTIYCYVGGTNVGALDDYYQGNTATSYKDQDWISGQDFTFNYIGTTGHDLNDVYEYIRVYEDGYQLTHYKWEMPGTNTAVNKVLNNVNTGETGYVQNTATYGQYTVSTSGNHKNYWKLSQPVTLAHDENWEFNMTAEGIHTDTIIMSAQNTSAANATHIFFTVKSGHQMVHMGYRNPTGSSHTNYGVDVTEVIPGFSMMDKHTYVLKNVVLPTGGNMVYLYVDDIYIGPLNNKHKGGYNLQATNSTEISGLDFTFHYVACDNSSLLYGFFDDTKIYDLEIRSKTSLHNSYEWVPGGVGLSSTVATDTKGNQISFASSATGMIDSTVSTAGIVGNEDYSFQLDSKGLKFSTNKIMDGRYSAYVAMAIHEKGFAPTALAVDGIDIGHEAQMFKKITVLPANVVYYEDDFPAVHYYGTSVNSFTQLGNVSNTTTDYSDTKYHASGSSSDLTQSPEQDTPFGSDDAYQGIFSNASGSSVHTIAINNDGPLAWFRFKGTGFELDARTSATEAGMIFVEIYPAADVVMDTNGNPAIDASTGFVDGIPVDIIPVNPLFDQGNVIGDEFQAVNGGNEAIYQVPIMYCDDLAYGEYIVVISGVENLNFDEGNAHVDSYLYLDGIRIYNPLGTDVPEYGDEQSMVFQDIRQEIVDGNILVSDYNESAGLQVGTGLMAWTEKYNDKDYTGQNTYTGHAVNNVNDYLMDGPNNEVYLDGTFSNGALVLYVRQASGNNNLLQVGVRALDVGLYYGAGSTGMRANLMLGVMGTTASGTTEPGWHYIATIASGTEQYYNIPYTLAPVVTIDGALYHQVVIKVAAYDEATPAMVSFTNIKRSEGLTICESQFLAADKVDAEGNLLTESTGYTLMNRLTTQMSAYRTFALNEAEPGSDFVVETPTTPDENAPAIIPGYPSLAFEGEVRYNIYFNVENMDDVSLEDMGLITFGTEAIDGTITDAVDVIPGALFSGSNYVVHTNGIAAKNLGDDLYFKVYAKLADGSYVYSSLLSYSALAYAENRLANSNDQQLKSLVVAMLNYGASAQQFFGYRTDALMNAGLTAEQKALANAYSADMATPVVKADASRLGAFASTGGFNGGYASVSFTGAFMLNYYFTPDKAVEGTVTMYTWDAETYNSVTELTAENAIGVQSMTINEAGEYVGTVTGMAAKEIGETVYVAVVYQAGGTTYCSGVVAYNIDSYCASHAANSASAMQELAAATTVYGYYAKNYFAN